MIKIMKGGLVKNFYATPFQKSLYWQQDMHNRKYITFSEVRI